VVSDTPAEGGPLGDPIERPGVLRLLWYCIGGALPRKHSTWVLYDLTARTWALRHFARTGVIVLPLLGIYLLLMPSSLAIRLLTGLTFAGGAFLFSLVNILVDTDRRAVRAGYKSGFAGDVREARSHGRNTLATYQRRERIAQRRARR
jgi:hypothetical protein